MVMAAIKVRQNYCVHIGKSQTGIQIVSFLIFLLATEIKCCQINLTENVFKRLFAALGSLYERKRADIADKNLNWPVRTDYMRLVTSPLGDFVDVEKVKTS